MLRYELTFMIRRVAAINPDKNELIMIAGDSIVEVLSKFCLELGKVNSKLEQEIARHKMMLERHNINEDDIPF